MDSDEIDTYLLALDEDLEKRPIRQPVRIVVVGGVFMAFFLRNRVATKDVDSIPLDFPDTTNPTCRSTSRGRIVCWPSSFSLVTNAMLKTLPPRALGSLFERGNRHVCYRPPSMRSFRCAVLESRNTSSLSALAAFLLLRHPRCIPALCRSHRHR